jgi:threonine/homoserine/homoserine lactone efflux protein
MFGIHDFSLFLAAGILLNLAPGSDTVYILGRSVAQGRGAGLASALGICVGSIFHTCAAALGLSAISGYIGTRFQRYQIAGRRVFGFSRSQNAARSPQAFEFAVPFPVAHNGGGISPGCLNQYSESESGTVFSRVPSQFIDPTSNSKIARFSHWVLHSSRPEQSGALS